MKSRFTLILVFLLLLFSCSRESFSLSGERLSRTIIMKGEERKEEVVISLSLSGNADDDYSFLLISPSKDLRWEGKLQNNGSSYVSDTLGITPGASFEEGDYTLYVYSSNGSSTENTLTMAKEEGNYTYSNALSKNDASLTFYDRDGAVVDNIIDAARAYITYTDRYSNKIKLTIDMDF